MKDQLQEDLRLRICVELTRVSVPRGAVIGLVVFAVEVITLVLTISTLL